MFVRGGTFSTQSVLFLAILSSIWKIFFACQTSDLDLFIWALADFYFWVLFWDLLLACLSQYSSSLFSVSTIDVLYLDHGNTERVPLTAICNPTPNNIGAYPQQAKRFTLGGIESVSSSRYYIPMTKHIVGCSWNLEVCTNIHNPRAQQKPCVIGAGRFSCWAGRFCLLLAQGANVVKNVRMARLAIDWTLG